MPAGTRAGFPSFCGRSAVYDGFEATEEDLVDFQSGAVTRIAGPEHGAIFGDPVMSELWIAWASWRQDSASSSEPSRRPLHWVISAVPTSDPTAAPIEIARQTNTEPPFPVHPVLAIDGDLLAYTIESAQPGHPQANAIVVTNLATGANVAQVQTAESIWALDLSGENIIYSEGIQDQNGFYPNTRVMLAVGAGSPTQIAQYGYEVAIDGQRLVWAQDSADTYSPVEGGQTIVTATVSNLQPVQLSRQSTASQTYEGYWPAAGDGLVSWHDMPRGTPGDQLEIWDPQTGVTVPIFNVGTLTVSGLCGGWVGWETAIESPPGNLFDAFYDAPIDAVKRLFQ